MHLQASFLHLCIPPSYHTQTFWYSIGMKSEPLRATMTYPVCLLTSIDFDIRGIPRGFNDWGWVTTLLLNFSVDIMHTACFCADIFISNDYKQCHTIFQVFNLASSLYIDLNFTYIHARYCSPPPLSRRFTLKMIQQWIPEGDINVSVDSIRFQ